VRSILANDVHFCFSAGRPNVAPATASDRNVAPVPVTITTATVSKAKADARPGARRYDIVDAKSRGLSLRVSPSGVQWSLRFQLNGKDKRLALGDVDLWTIAEARSLVDRAQGMIRDRMGIPDEVWLDRMRAREGKVAEVTGAAEPPPTPARARFRWSFAEGRDAFLEEVQRTRRQGTFDDYSQKLQAADLAHLERTPLPQITRQDLSAVLADIAKSGRESTAEGTQRVLSRFFNWLSEDGQIANSGVQPGVMRGLKAPERALRESRDDDPWSDGYVPPLAEVARIIAIARSGAVHPNVGGAIELACWTAQRRRSISEAVVEDFEFISEEVGGLWHIPPISTKGGRIKRRPHVIPLPPPAWVVWKRMMAIKSETSSPWLFRQVRAKAKGMDLTHISPSSITHSLGWMPGVQSTPHDLRRAFATHGEAQLGLLRADTQSILDHSETSGVEIVMKRGALSRGVTGGHYALHDGTHRTWAIMNAWASALVPEIEKAIAALEPVAEIKAAMRAARYGEPE
jgi:integrase